MTMATDITWRTACVTSAFCSVVAAVYVVAAAGASSPVLLFVSFAPIVAVCAWLQKDAKRFAVGSIQDWGFFIYLAWPAVIPWYAFKTRGASGWRVATALLLLVCAPTLVAYATWLLLYALWFASHGGG